MDAAIALANNVVTMKYRDIPEGALTVSKKDVMDSLGVAVAGSTAPGGREALALVKDWGGKAESTLIADGARVPAVNAAWANGSMVHALDYDDIHGSAVLHAGASVVPAAFAAAELAGKVNGKELLAAVTLGIDLECRLGLARTGPRGWLLTQTYGVFGAAAAAGRLLGLGQETMLHALGLAYVQASGNAQAISDAAVARGMTGGFGAMGGVLAVLAARAGITGPRNILEGKFGLYPLYHQGKYNPQALTGGLGQRFEGAGLSFKRYPCCARNHGFIDAALELARQYDIRPDSVKAIDIFVGKDTFDEVCDPVDVRRRPPTTVDAQLSAPYTVAVAIARRKVVLRDFTPAAIKDETVLALSGRVTPHLVPEYSQKDLEPGIVEIKLADGRTLRSRPVQWAYSESDNPIPLPDLEEKFRDCAAYSAKKLPAGQVEEAIALLRSLEDLDDVSRVLRLLS